MLLVTGPVTKNMREALWRTYQATPEPKWVVAVGDCAIDGGLFAGSYAVVGGASAVVPVDLHIRGCPPRPTQLLEGLLGLLEAGSNDRKRHGRGRSQRSRSRNAARGRTDGPVRRSLTATSGLAWRRRSPATGCGSAGELGPDTPPPVMRLASFHIDKNIRKFRQV